MQNWKTVGPVTVWDTTNSTGETFADLDTLIRSRRFDGVSDRLGDARHLDKLAKSGNLGWYRYIIRDECGLIIPLWKIEERAQQLGVFKRWRSRWTGHRPHQFRRGPVYGIHCFRGGNSYFRSIKTSGEIRENSFCNDYDEDTREYGVRCRPARTKKNLPEPWDDILRSDYNNRNWKKHRRHQWKARK